MKHYSVRLPEELALKIDQRCVQTGKGTATTIRELIHLGAALKEKAEAKSCSPDELLASLQTAAKHEKQNLAATFESLSLIRELAKSLLNHDGDRAANIQRESSENAMRVFK